METNHKLSAVIITFNEERNIERCLKSLEHVADEIIVVDSFSTDKTQEICQKYEVRFIQNPFDGHIEQKNFAMNQASFDYVLSLDADEALDENLTNGLLKIKETLSTFDAYYFNRLTNYCGQWIKHTGWYPDKKLRVWNKSKGAWGGENPHDRVILREGSSKQYIKGDLLHYSYYSINDHIKQIQFFTDISAKAAVEKGKTTTIFMIVIKPLGKFLSDYILKGGFRDGFYGFVISKTSAYAKFLKYLKIYELNRGGKIK